LENRLSHEEVVEQSAQVVQSGRLALLTSVDPSLLSSLLGDISVWLMESGDDVMRIDGLESHTAADIISALCRYLEVSGQDLMTGLRMRGEAGNPVCVVIDNVECLEGKALQVLRSLLEGTSGGVGLLLGGEPDAQLYLEDAGIAQPFFVDIDTQAILPEYHDIEEDDGIAGGVAAQLPWRHIFAAAGLGLLAWLFWPTDGVEPDTRSLSLPAKIEAQVSDVTSAEERPENEGSLTSEAGGRKAPPDMFVPTTREPSVKESVAAVPQVRATKESEVKALATPRVEVKSEASKPEPSAEVKVKPTAPPVAKSTPPVKKSVATVRDPSLTGLAADLGYHQEEWLLTRPASQWVLQVALATSEDGARSLLDQIGRSGSAYYRTTRNSRQVYIVLAGPWSTRDAAAAGKASLPPTLRALGPFPRALSAVHKEIGITP
jgi:DamX protein